MLNSRSQGVGGAKCFRCKIGHEKKDCKGKRDVSEVRCQRFGELYQNFSNVLKIRRGTPIMSSLQKRKQH